MVKINKKQGTYPNHQRDESYTCTLSLEIQIGRAVRKNKIAPNTWNTVNGSTEGIATWLLMNASSSLARSNANSWAFMASCSIPAILRSGNVYFRGLPWPSLKADTPKHLLMSDKEERLFIRMVIIYAIMRSRVGPHDCNAVVLCRQPHDVVRSYRHSIIDNIL